MDAVAAVEGVFWTVGIAEDFVEGAAGTAEGVVESVEGAVEIVTAMRLRHSFGRRIVGCSPCILCTSAVRASDNSLRPHSSPFDTGN